MKIAYLHQYYNTPDQPGGTRSYEFATRLAKRGHKVHIITTAFHGEGSSVKGWATTVEADLHVHRLHLPYDNTFSFYRRIYVFLVFAIRAAAKTYGIRPDLVFATSTPLTIALPAMFAKYTRNIPMVFEVRDVWPELPVALGILKNRPLIWLARMLERATYRSSARVVALSPGMAASVARTGYPQHQLLVIPNACDENTWNTTNSDGQSWLSARSEFANRDVVVYAGSLGYTYGICWLADLAAQCRLLAPSLCFVVVGSGSDRDLFLKRAAQLEVLDVNLFVLPPVPKKDVPYLLAGAMAGVSTILPIPELQSNSQNKFFDYLAAGIPVFINYGGWQQEILEQNGAGARLNYYDFREAAKTMIDFVYDQSRMHSAGVASKHLARTDYSRDALCERLSLALEEVKANSDSC